MSTFEENDKVGNTPPSNKPSFRICPYPKFVYANKPPGACSDIYGIYFKKESVDKNSVTLAKKWISGEPISPSIFEILYTFSHDFRPHKSHVCQGALGTLNAT